MSTVKFKTVIRLDKLSKSTNEVPVCLRITKDRKTTYKTLIHVHPRCWNSKEQCVVHHKNADILNAIISQKRAQIERETCLLTLQQEDLSIVSIRNKINSASSDFFEFAKKYCEATKHRSYCTYQRVKSIVKKLREFHGDSCLSIKHINEDFIKRYEYHLAHNIGNSRNTIAISMKFISKIVSDIYKDLELNEETNPFKKLKYQFEPGSRQYLTAEEIVKIRDLPIPADSPLYNVREIFIFECYTGLRISDILTLKWENIAEDIITLKMRKTERLISLPLQKNVREILERRRKLRNSKEFVFDYLKASRTCEDATENEHRLVSAIGASTAYINKRLKIIGKIANINKNISTHVGRHSFATMLLTNGNDLPVIQELMGHHDIKVTQIYAKVVSSRKAEAINTLNRL